MAAERKLKGEIDKTLKKVVEGQEEFEQLWNQVHAARGDLDTAMQLLARGGGAWCSAVAAGSLA